MTGCPCTGQKCQKGCRCKKYEDSVEAGMALQDLVSEIDDMKSAQVR